MGFSPTRDDWDFIDNISKILPKLKNNFQDALDVSAQDCFEWAYDMQYQVYRDGLLRHTSVSLSHAETTGEHVDDLIRMATEYYSRADASAISDILSIHDMPEAIAHVHMKTYEVEVRRDINEYAQYQGREIDKATKQRIETLAAHIIFDRFPQEKALWFGFEQGSGNVNQNASCLDKIHPYLRCLDYVEQGYQFEDFEVFWDVLDAKMQKNPAPHFVQLYEDIFKSKQEDLFAHIGMNGQQLIPD